MENKDWREEIEKDFDELFFEGERNSVYCKKHKVLATPFEVKSFARFQLEKILKSKQEEIKKVKFNRYDEYGDFCEEVVGLDDIIKILK